jgi:hypothetical protein
LLEEFVLPELSRFFGIVIRMFVEAGGPTIRRIFMLIIKIT